jgi:glucosylceramidase
MKFRPALFSFSILTTAFFSAACSSTLDGEGGGTGGEDPADGAGGGVVDGGGGGSNPGAGGGANPGAGGGANPGAGGGADPGAGGGADSGAGGGADPGAGGGADPGGGGSDIGAGGGDLGIGGSAMGAGGSEPVVEPTLTTSSEATGWSNGEVTVGGSNATITVNDGQTYQTWDGFGGTFNEKGWEAMKSLSQEDRDLVLRLLFSSTEGAGFTYGRVPVGSSDYGLDRYTLNETDGDYAMASFSIDRDKRDLIPYIKAALEVKPNIRFWASPWSPPTWMKDNNAFDRGNMKSDTQTLDAHALYLARFVEEYALEGITIEAIHPQNEPGYAQDYPSCLWSAQTMTTYIANHLGPLFAERLPDTEVWLGTMSNESEATIVSSVMGNSTAASYIKGIGLQWNMEGQATNYSNAYDFPIMQSEHRCGNYPWEGSYQQVAPNDYAYGVESWGLIKGWIEKGVNSYLAWNMVLDTDGRSLDTVRPWSQNALLVVNTGAGTLKQTVTYNVFRHLAQFVEPGAVRVGVSGDALAFKNPDGSIVTVIRNSGGSPSQQTLSVGGTMVQFEIPGNGWATVNWQG